jgi:hypothetical protein
VIVVRPAVAGNDDDFFVLDCCFPTIMTSFQQTLFQVSLFVGMFGAQCSTECRFQFKSGHRLIRFQCIEQIRCEHSGFNLRNYIQDFFRMPALALGWNGHGNCFMKNQRSRWSFSEMIFLILGDEDLPDAAPVQ